MEGGREEEAEEGRGSKGWVCERKTLKGTTEGTSGGGESFRGKGEDAEAEGDSRGGVDGEIRRGEEEEEGAGASGRRS